MRWQTGRRSENVEDRRGMGVPLVAGGGIGTIILVLVALFFGFDPGAIMQTGPDSRGAERASPQHDTARDFVSVVLADTEDTWREIFQRMKREYHEPTLVLFTGAVRSACGMAGAAVGPFYCPQDERIYLDLSFFRELGDRFGARGDFAQAYVIAHEVGHHVQKLLGVARIGELGGGGRENAVSVRRELQADCFAGIWAHHADRTRHLLESGDLEEGLAAAAAVGDDRLQRRAQGQVAPESFTHGSSAQRVHWFKRGFASGHVADCDTFRVAQP
jgi:predicted metalloprotease